MEISVPWAKIDDGFYDHPKILKVGLAAVGLHCLALSYCARHLTDGFVPMGFVGSRKGYAERLAGAGLWDAVDGGYQIHDYLDYNPSAEQMKEQRLAARVRMNNWRTSDERSEKYGRSSSSPSRTRPVPVPKNEKTTTFASTPAVVFAEDMFQVPSSLLGLWQKAYPAVHVPEEVRRAHSWAVANPKNRKSNWTRFIVAWLKRAQDRAPRVEPAVGGEKLPDWVREARGD